MAETGSRDHLLTSDWLQHYSGLDFLYFHANQVWGVGPKVGGKRAGLLNFAAVDCPYEVRRKYETSNILHFEEGFTRLCLDYFPMAIRYKAPRQGQTT